jgi:hypothetical protein
MPSQPIFHRPVQQDWLPAPKRVRRLDSNISVTIDARSISAATPAANRAVQKPALSVLTFTVPRVESDDVVDPGDAVIQALLALTAENTDDDEKREKLLDAILTIPPLAEWPPDCRQKLWDTCQFIKSLAEDLRKRGEIRDSGGD